MTPNEEIVFVDRFVERNDGFIEEKTFKERADDIAKLEEKRRIENLIKNGIECPNLEYHLNSVDVKK
jgi:hypothetical protein